MHSDAKSLADNVDLYVGAMLEDPVANGMVGPTLACLIGNQFKRLRDGDRLFYAANGTFTEEQLTELRKHSISRLICDTGEAFGAAPRDGFLFTSAQNVIPCNQIPGIDLNAWRE